MAVSGPRCEPTDEPEVCQPPGQWPHDQNLNRAESCTRRAGRADVGCFRERVITIGDQDAALQIGLLPMHSVE